jgi:hypothetical protein
MESRITKIERITVIIRNKSIDKVMRGLELENSDVETSHPEIELRKPELSDLTYCFRKLAEKGIKGGAMSTIIAKPIVCDQQDRA